MAMKLLLLSLAIVFLSQNSSGFPRDVGLAVIEDVNGNENSLPNTKSEEPVYESSSVVSTQLPEAPNVVHRVACDNQDEEPTEDIVCQEHCLPKGYSYGLCVSKTCTCI
ncbi:uncharacterized protein LOC106133566 [Amyelois transitella]|uniref:uncharacterized protein LOC106133566 n=1 Tax=Amyelois transitella TaxID=680683 RepID=UPI00298FEFA1|nr:uncharacterized protein LOC106133566 [Amyelois transitella]